MNIKKKFPQEAAREDLNDVEVFLNKEDGQFYYLDRFRKKVLVNSSKGDEKALTEISLKLRTHPTNQNVLHFKNTDEATWQEYFTKGLSSQQPSIRLDNGNLAQMYYVQFIMPDGTYVFEAYDMEEVHTPATGNNGYWIAMKEEGKDLVKVSELPMTDIFWNNWYDYSYPNAETNTINLVYANSTFRGNRPIQMSQVEIGYSDANGLYLVQEQYNDFGGIDGSTLFLEQLGYTVGPLNSIGQFEPEYTGNNSYFEMRTGPNAGWKWFIPFGSLDQFQMIGINMFTYEIRPINLNTDPDFLSIDNLTPLIRWRDAKSNSDLGFIIQLGNGGSVDNINDTGLTGFWSKYKTDPTKVCWMRMRDYSGDFQETGGSFSGQYHYQFHGKYLTLVEANPNGRADNGQVLIFTRINLDSDGSNPEKEIVAAPMSLLQAPFFEGWASFLGGMFSYPLKNSVVFGHWFDTRSQGQFGENILFVWRNGESTIETIHSSQVYVSHFDGGKTIGKDIINSASRNQMGYTVVTENFNIEF